MAPKTRTEHVKGALSPDAATALYLHLRDALPWTAGVPSRRHGFTRKACALDPARLPPEIAHAVGTAAGALRLDSMVLRGVYVNYYENGTHWTPNHSHPGTVQLIVSLGATRTLTVGKRTLRMANGDVAIFGASTHGVPQEPEVAEGRISIALFMA